MLRNNTILDTHKSACTLLFGPACGAKCASTKIKEQRLLTSDIKFLRRIRGYMKADRIRNATIWMELNVEPLEWMRTAYWECCVDVNLRGAMVSDTHWNVGEAEDVQCLNWQKEMMTTNSDTTCSPMMWNCRTLNAITTLVFLTLLRLGPLGCS